MMVIDMIMSVARVIARLVMLKKGGAKK